MQKNINIPCGLKVMKVKIWQYNKHWDNVDFVSVLGIGRNI